jgi:hypothetical protein
MVRLLIIHQNGGTPFPDPVYAGALVYRAAHVYIIIIIHTHTYIMKEFGVQRLLNLIY